jgi:hypothetical protein
MRVKRRCGNLSARRQDPEGDRQIQTARVFWQVGWGEIHSNATGRKFELCLVQGRPDSILGFTNLSIGEPNYRERGQARA